MLNRDLAPVSLFWPRRPVWQNRSAETLDLQSEAMHTRYDALKGLTDKKELIAKTLEIRKQTLGEKGTSDDHNTLCRVALIQMGSSREIGNLRDLNLPKNAALRTAVEARLPDLRVQLAALRSGPQIAAPAAPAPVATPPPPMAAPAAVMPPDPRRTAAPPPPQAVPAVAPPPRPKNMDTGILAPGAAMFLMNTLGLQDAPIEVKRMEAGGVVIVPKAGGDEMIVRGYRMSDLDPVTVTIAYLDPAKARWEPPYEVRDKKIVARVAPVAAPAPAAPPPTAAPDKTAAAPATAADAAEYRNLSPKQRKNLQGTYYELSEALPFVPVQADMPDRRRRMTESRLPPGFPLTAEQREAFSRIQGTMKDFADLRTLAYHGQLGDKPLTSAEWARIEPYAQDPDKVKEAVRQLKTASDPINERTGAKTEFGRLEDTLQGATERYAEENMKPRYEAVLRRLTWPVEVPDGMQEGEEKSALEQRYSILEKKMPSSGYSDDPGSFLANKDKRYSVVAQYEEDLQKWEQAANDTALMQEVQAYNTHLEGKVPPTLETTARTRARLAAGATALVVKLTQEPINLSSDARIQSGAPIASPEELARIQALEKTLRSPGTPMTPTQLEQQERSMIAVQQRLADAPAKAVADNVKLLKEAAAEATKVLAARPLPEPADPRLQKVLEGDKAAERVLRQRITALEDTAASGTVSYATIDTAKAASAELKALEKDTLALTRVEGRWDRAAYVEAYPHYEALTKKEFLPVLPPTAATSNDRGFDAKMQQAKADLKASMTEGRDITPDDIRLALKASDVLGREGDNENERRAVQNVRRILKDGGIRSERQLPFDLADQFAKAGSPGRQLGMWSRYEIGQLKLSTETSSLFSGPVKDLVLKDEDKGVSLRILEPPKVEGSAAMALLTAKFSEYGANIADERYKQEIQALMTQDQLRDTSNLQWQITEKGGTVTTDTSEKIIAKLKSMG